MRKSLELNAVWDSDLKPVLERLGILDEVMRGRTTCRECGRAVNLDNLGAIVTGRKPSVICDCSLCLHAATSALVATV